jgi:small-conductance mechanosensitive channel
MDVDWWKRAAIVAAVVLVTLVVARLADRALTRRLKHEPQAMTRYRVLRRSLVAAIIAFGVLSALLVIPGIRAVAGGILASSAVVGLVIGMAARSTLGNFVSGIMIAFTQPLRLGDEVKVADASGTVQEIALTYTILQTGNGARFYIPNEKLASDTIQNSTIARSEHLAEVTIPVPISSDLDRVLALVAEEAKGAPDAMPDTEPHITVSDFEADRVVVRIAAWAQPARVADLEASLRLAAHRRLRQEGLL